MYCSYSSLCVHYSHLVLSSVTILEVFVFSGFWFGLVWIGFLFGLVWVFFGLCVFGLWWFVCLGFGVVCLLFSATKTCNYSRSNGQKSKRILHHEFLRPLGWSARVLDSVHCLILSFHCAHVRITELIS